MTERGFIDLHSHLLPGVDDGCPSLEYSLDCVEQLIRAGFVGSVCSPHVCVECCSHNTPATIEVAVEELRREVAATGLEYELWSGAEVRLAPSTVEWFEEHGVPTLGHGRHVLLDYWGDDWPDYCGDAIAYLLRNDYTPMLAHPARMGADDELLSRVLEELRRQGVKLQCNLRCLVNKGDGPRARDRIRRLLAEGHVHAVATDMHGPDDLPNRLEGIRLLRDEFGEELLATPLAVHPRSIIAAPAASLVG